MTGRLVLRPLSQVAALTIGLCMSCGDREPHYLNASANLVLTPGSVVISPHAQYSDGDDAGVLVSTNSTITVYASATRRSEVDGAHVDVCIGSCVKPGTMEAGDSLCQQGLTQWAVLDLEPGGGCAVVSPAQVHCVLNSDGAARFQVRATGQQYLCGNDIEIVAKSRDNISKPASIFVGQPVPSGSTVRIVPNSIEIGFQTPGPLVCEDSSTSPGCDSIRRQGVPFAVSIEKDGSPLRGAYVPLKLYIAPDQVARTITAKSVWIDRNPDCSSQASIEYTAIDAATGNAPVLYICGDGGNGDFKLQASVVAPSGAAIGPAVAAVTLKPQPVRVSVTSQSSGAESSSEAGARVVTWAVTACDGSIATNVPVTLELALGDIGSLTDCSAPSEEVSTCRYVPANSDGGKLPEYLELAASIPSLGAACHTTIKLEAQP